ncbi:response regulator [Chitinophaga sp. Cy-1792]|uniref:ATP-binding response regulator n=1 Tax=Chitinophaga sp. Cy-1792 TaxID=2608339 RepID=UPI001422E831|nr:response regulator [Chitinophaga sp. Cy-1792]NIG55562.1 response regulator [Chitinophaga sp. Cy-1792]
MLVTRKPESGNALTAAMAANNSDSISVINTLSILSGFFMFVNCALLYTFTHDLSVMVAGSLASIAFMCLPVLNLIRCTTLANILFLALHNGMALYLQIGKGMVVGESMLVVFLIIVSLLVFTQTPSLVASISCCFATLVLIRISKHTDIFGNNIVQQDINLLKDYCTFKLLALTICAVAFFKNYSIRLIKALRNSNEALEKALQEKTFLSKALSHEIRNPLHSLTGITEVLTREVEKKNEYNALVEYIRDLNASSGYAMSVVNNVLELDNESKQCTPPESFAVVAWLREIVKSFQYQANSKHVKLICEAEEDIPVFILSQKNRLNKIVINLLLNAIKFTRDNTVVTVTLSHEQGRLLLSIKDRGQGMSQEKMKKVFDLYETEQNNYLPGTGIGLYVASSLAKSIDGTLTLESEVGKGSTFTLSWPMVRSNAPANIPASSLQLFAGMKVLAIDDDTFSQKYLQRFFDDTPVQVRQAMNGQEGLSVFREWRPDVVLLDVFLGDMSGHEILREINNMSFKTHVIIVSGNNCDMDKQRFLNAGAENYLVKPLPRKSLFAAIEKVMTAPRTATLAV